MILRGMYTYRDIAKFEFIASWYEGHEACHETDTATRQTGYVEHHLKINAVEKSVVTHYSP